MSFEEATEGRQAAELNWHYGPTDWNPDPGRMWHYDCPGGRGEVMYDKDGSAYCLGCKASQPPENTEENDPVSNKMECPGCGSYASSVLRAYGNGNPCPECGLSAGATLEIRTIRQARADDALKTKLETAIKERDEAQRELRWAKARLEHLAEALGESVERIGKPLRDEEPESWN